MEYPKLLQPQVFRVGWAFGPSKVINKMKAILGHVGAWSPKAEQLATASFLKQKNSVDEYLSDIKVKLSGRLEKLYNGLKSMKNDGLPVDVITPQAALYLTLKLDLTGLTKASGEKINTTEEITDYVLKEAGIAIVPFYAFGTERNSKWYRLSVGTSVESEIPEVLNKLKTALEKLN